MSTTPWTDEDLWDEDEAPPLPKVYRLDEIELPPQAAARRTGAAPGAKTPVATTRGGKAPARETFTRKTLAREALDERADDRADDRKRPAEKTPAGEIGDGELGGRKTLAGVTDADKTPDEGLPAGQTLLALAPGQTLRLCDVRPTRRGRAALFADDADGQETFLFSVDTETAARLHLVPGAVLDADALADARSQSDLRGAKDKALQCLATRDYAAGELQQKLCRRYDPDTAAAAVAEMRRLGLLDDAAFARHRAAYLAQRGKSRREIGYILAGLGVARESVAAALEDLPQEDDTLRRLIQKQYAAKLAAGRRDTVFAALARRGFAAADIRRALAAWEDEA